MLPLGALAGGPPKLRNLVDSNEDLHVVVERASVATETRTCLELRKQSANLQLFLEVPIWK